MPNLVLVFVDVQILDSDILNRISRVAPNHPRGNQWVEHVDVPKSNVFEKGTPLSGTDFGAGQGPKERTLQK